MQWLVILDITIVITFNIFLVCLSVSVSVCDFDRVGTILCIVLTVG